MNKKEKRIIVIDTVYSLFLYYLICGYKETDIIIVSGGIPKSIKKKFKHVSFPHMGPVNYSTLKTFAKIKTKINRIIKRSYGIIKLRLTLFIKTRNFNISVYGLGHTYFSFPLYEYENSYLIEDGLANYMELTTPNYNLTRLEKFFGFYVGWEDGFGTHKNIKKIYLTKKEIPKIIKDKTEVIDLQKLWNEKTETEKNHILELFNIKEAINNINDNTILLLTQCISEDNILPFDEEINIYNYLIKKQKDKNIVIKTHPREKKDYHLIFPELTVIDQPFPLEIFKVIDVNIKKIITVSSTAALNFKETCEIEFYDKKTSSDELNNMIDAFKKQLKNGAIEKNGR